RRHAPEAPLRSGLHRDARRSRELPPHRGGDHLEDTRGDVRRLWQVTQLTSRMPSVGSRAALVLLVGLWCAGCAGSAAAYDYSKEPDPRKSEFVIGASDRLSIRVWRNPDLSTDAVVRPDGTITMPLIGDISADGKTPSELKQEITKLLAAYVRDEG